MNPISAACLKAGLVTPAMLAEMKRFSPTIDPEAEAEDPVDLETAAKILEAAFASEQYVLVRETDLEIVQQYTATSKPGILHAVFTEEQQGDIDVTFGRTPLGGYIIAWHSDSIEDVMTNGQTYLVDGDTTVFFKDVRELFFGEQKAFLVCTPSPSETNGNAA